MKNKYLKYKKKYIGPMIIILMLNIVGMIFNIFLPLMFKYLIDKIIAKENIDFMFKFSMGIIFLFIISSLFDFLSKKWYCSVLIKFEKEVKENMFNYIQKVSMKYFKTKSKGDYISRIINDVNALIQIFNDFLYPCILGSISLLCVIIILFKMQWILACYCVLSIPIFMFTSRYFGKKTQIISKQLKANMSEHLEVLDEGLSGILVNKTFNYYDEEKKIYSENLKKLLVSSYSLLMNKLYSKQIFMLTASVFPIIILISGGYMIVNDIITVGTLVAFISYLNYLYNPVILLANLNLAYKEAIVSYKRISEIMDMPLEEETNDFSISEDIVCVHKDKEYKSKIEFKNISYSVSDREIIKDSSFLIEAGQLVAIIGKNGIGKSTLFNLMLRIVEADKGEILIDNIPISSMNIYELRKLISVVPQDSFLYSTTIRENILIGNNKATQEEVENILNTVQLKEFVQNLPENLDTKVVLRGSNLSGGEKQKIVLSRGLIKQSSILLLDEATASMDSASECILFDTIRNLKSKKTIFMITHDMRNLYFMDKIIFLESNGKYSVGTHEKLINSNENYRNLYEGVNVAKLIY